MPPSDAFTASTFPSGEHCAVSHAVGMSVRSPRRLPRVASAAYKTAGLIQNWRGRDGNDPSVDIAKDADQRFYKPLVGVATERMFRSRQVLALMGEI